MSIKIFSLGAAIAFIGSYSIALGAIQVTMEKIPSNNNPGIDISGQLNIQFLSATEAASAYGALVSAMGANDVLLTVQNVVGTASNVAELYVNGGGALNSLVSPSSPLVLGGSHSFGIGSVAPPNLPGGAWSTDQSFSADVNPGPPARGLDQSADILGMIYTSNSPFGLGAVQAALTGGLLRIGVHVRSIGPNEGSDSYQNTPAVVPEATTIVVWSVIGVTALLFARRKPILI